MKLISSFRYAIRGTRIAIQEQRNMKIHLVAATIIVVLGFYLNFEYVDWCITIISIGIVVGMELINTSIEGIVNFISPEKKAEAGRIKDLSAGAVLIVSLAALIIGIVLVISKINL